jgi:hypothetical protein
MQRMFRADAEELVNSSGRIAGLGLPAAKHTITMPY